MKAVIAPWDGSFNWQTYILLPDGRRATHGLHYTFFFAKRRYRKLQRQIKQLEEL